MSGLLFSHTQYRVPVVSIHNREEALLAMRRSHRADLRHRLEHKKDWQAGMELGHCLRLGIDGVRDLGQADKVYKRALDHIFWEDGNNNASIALTKGFSHFHGWGQNKDVKKAIPYFQRARRLLSDECRNGDANAAFDLGALYYGGLGGQADIFEAVRYYEQAANQYHALAITVLSDIYLHGAVQVRNSPKAFDLLEKLAAMDEPLHRAFISEAQFRLGALAQEGIGHPICYVEAYIWFAIAASADHEEAGRRRRALEPRLTPAQLHAAQTRLQHWRRGQSLPVNTTTYPGPTY